MKTITTTAIVALMTATLGLTAIVPAYAQDAAPTQEQTFRQGGPGFHLRQDGYGGPGRGGLVDFLGGSSEAVEIALVRLSHAVEMTSEQQALFDTLKTDALAAAETFTTATEALRPAEGQTAEASTLSERFENRIAFETARLAALEAVQPSLTAFFDSLTAEQQAQLTPQRPDHGGNFGKGGPRHMGQQGGPDAPAPASKG
ncbi:Spy/CpxP family protein refolding chaperone [Devosia ginsengisoli]|nr:Spy/CpxP family protein refolding chaperone [Devosia ginsengisoli]